MELKIFRETSLPASLQPASIYLVGPAARPNYVEMYVTSVDGSAVRRCINEADIQTLISASVSAINTLTVVADIPARNALSPTSVTFVFVRDATGDPTVNSGGATYIWDTSDEAWVKVSEAESLDVSLSWASLSGKPTSTPSQIDSAVTSAHTHSNKSSVDKIGQDANGMLTYDGVLPHIGWDSTGW